MSDHELDKTIGFLKGAQRHLAESQEALRQLSEIQQYGHYTLDVKLGGSTSGPGGSGYHEMKVVLDFMDSDYASKKKDQVKLFECLRHYLTVQIARYEREIVEHRQRIKELA